MALVPYLNTGDVAERYRHLLERPITLHQALVNSPDALTHFQGLAEWIRWECTLDARLRELFILYIGYVERSPYEWSHHIVLGRQFGVTDQDVRAVIDFAEGREAALSELELLVLEAVKQITIDQRVGDTTWAALTEHFESGSLTDIVIIASFYSMVVRVLGSLRIDVEPEYQQALVDFPLPHDLVESR